MDRKDSKKLKAWKRYRRVSFFVAANGGVLTAVTTLLNWGKGG